MHVRAASEKKDAYNNNDNDKNKNKWCVVSSCVFGVHNVQVDSVGALDGGIHRHSLLAPTSWTRRDTPARGSGVFVAVIESERVHVHSPSRR